MDANVRTDRETWEQNSGLRGVGAIMCFAALLLCGCASTINVPDKLPASTDLPAGYGTVIGSILMSAPTGVSDFQQKVIDSFKGRKCDATVGRFVVHHHQLFGTPYDTYEYPGDKYRVSFEVDVEKRFIIRAPAGSYSFQKISQIVPGYSDGGCTMERVAEFDIREGKTTYIGQLTIIAGFKSDKEVKWMLFFKGLHPIAVPELPEQLLNMTLSVTDTKAETLRDVGMDTSGPAVGLDTELMTIAGDGRGNWGIKPSPNPPPPAVPRRR